MLKFIFSFILVLFSFGTCFSQQPNEKDVLRLKNGDIFTGNIVLKTDQLVILNANDGKRYQFQLSEIDTIEKESAKSAKPAKASTGNFAGIVELNGGIARASSVPSIQTSPALAVTVALGSRNLFNTQTFGGIGTGMETIVSINQKKVLTFLPIFIQVNKSLTNSQLNPYIGMKSGYNFCLNKDYLGGMFVNLESGIHAKTTDKQGVNIGLFVKVQSISGTIIEKNELGQFTKNGTAPIYGMGINFAYLF